MMQRDSYYNESPLLHKTQLQWSQLLHWESIFTLSQLWHKEIIIMQRDNYYTESIITQGIYYTESVITLRVKC